MCPFGPDDQCGGGLRLDHPGPAPNDGHRRARKQAPQAGFFA